MIFLGLMHVLPKVCIIGLQGTNRAHNDLEKPKFQAEFLSKTNSIVTRKQGARCCS
jgi:hypothetical protein